MKCTADRVLLLCRMTLLRGENVKERENEGVVGVLVRSKSRAKPEEIFFNLFAGGSGVPSKLLFSDLCSSSDMRKIKSNLFLDIGDITAADQEREIDREGVFVLVG